MVKAFRLTPNSRLCIVPKAWHACFLDDFDTTWASILRSCARRLTR